MAGGCSCLSRSYPRPRAKAGVGVITRACQNPDAMAALPLACQPEFAPKQPKNDQTEEEKRKKRKTEGDHTNRTKGQKLKGPVKLIPRVA